MIFSFFLKKGGKTAAFFILIVNLLIVRSALSSTLDSDVESYISRANEIRLYDNPKWATLLHYINGASYVNDEKFLLSSPEFSLKNELAATIREIYTQEDRICEFPARYLWIQRELGTKKISLDSCHGLQEFKEKAPAENIYIVFASENITQPSSMMGHIFIKISGSDNNKKYREHAISFFTDSNTLNIPKLFFESMVIGKKGYFSLSPYEEKIDIYIRQEKRNIWEYKLNLSEFEKELITSHFFELKNRKMIYFFQKHNCATFVSKIISLVRDFEEDKLSAWITPLDVIKKIKNSDISTETLVQPSSKWAIRMLEETLPSNEQVLLKSMVEERNFDFTKKPASELNYYQLELINAYNNFLFDELKIEKQDWEKYRKAIANERAFKYAEITIDTQKYKKPEKTPPDSQISFGYSRVNEEDYLRLHILPVSHLIDDDNQQYFNENELRLFDLSILTKLGTRKSSLENFYVFSAKSYISKSLFTGGISGEFRLGLEPHLNQFLEKKLALNIGGGLGYTERPHQDFDLYQMLKSGIGYSQGRAYVYLQPEIGLIAREIYEMKTIFAASRTENQINSNEGYFKLSINQSKRITNNLSISIFHEITKNSKLSKEQTQINFKYLF